MYMREIQSLMLRLQIRVFTKSIFPVFLDFSQKHLIKRQTMGLKHLPLVKKHNTIVCAKFVYFIASIFFHVFLKPFCQNLSTSEYSLRILNIYGTQVSNELYFSKTKSFCTFFRTYLSYEPQYASKMFVLELQLFFVNVK